MGFAFVLSILAVSQPVISESEGSAHASLRQKVLRAMQANPKSIEKADFQIDDVAIYYRFGGLREFVNNPAVLPREFPVAAQFTIEAIRERASPWGPSSRRAMESFLRRAESLVAEQLSLVKGFRGPQQELVQSLIDRRQAIDRILLEAVEYFAKKECRCVAPIGTVAFYDCERRRCYYVRTQTFTSEPGFTFRIKSDPDGAHVSYALAGRYIAAEITGTLDDKDLWNNVLTEYRTLNGEYYFRATWDDGKKRSPISTLIDRDDTVTIKPDAPESSQGSK